MEEADAVFNHNEHGAGLIAFTLSRELGQHFSVQGAFSFTEVGFNYALSRNYSLLNPDSRYLSSSVGNCIGTVPILFNYHTKYNCNNWRWFAGIGPELVYSAENFNKVQGSDYTEEGITSGDELVQNTSMPSFATINLGFQFGIEKLYRKGGMLRFGFTGSKGFSEIGYSDVEYTVNGRFYSHSFSNDGSYAGMFVSWFFRPFNKGKVTQPVIQAN